MLFPSTENIYNIIVTNLIFTEFFWIFQNPNAEFRWEGWELIGISFYFASLVLASATPSLRWGSADSGAPDEGFLVFPKSPPTIAPNFLNSLCLCSAGEPRLRCHKIQRRLSDARWGTWTTPQEGRRHSGISTRMILFVNFDAAVKRRQVVAYAQVHLIRLDTTPTLLRSLLHADVAYMVEKVCDTPNSLFDSSESHTGNLSDRHGPRAAHF